MEGNKEKEHLLALKGIVRFIWILFNIVHKMLYWCPDASQSLSCIGNC